MFNASAHKEDFDATFNPVLLSALGDRINDMWYPGRLFMAQLSVDVNVSCDLSYTYTRFA